MSAIFSAKTIFVQTHDALIHPKDTNAHAIVMVITGQGTSAKTLMNAPCPPFTVLVVSVLILKDHTLVSARRYDFIIRNIKN